MSNQNSNVSKKGLIFKEGDQLEELYKYCGKYTTLEPPHLHSLNKWAYANNPHAGMLVPPGEGLLLSLLVSLRRPKVVLEIGCFLGYSALWIAEGLEYSEANPGRLYTVEVFPETAEIARQNISRANKDHLVEVINKPGQEVLDNWDSSVKIDMIFLDADKSGYIKYYDTVLERDLLADGGVIICDNTLFHGCVHPIEDTRNGKPYETPSNITEHIYNFNVHVQNDPRTENVLLPIFDGLTIIRKRKSVSVEKSLS
ncbi:hypothetical protein BB560_004111 [Smittium megazygosporum]|uniref:O-methyltransferase n=1 Tax=Smittium megazygosporum TaxID=133381 RepID=A0A2T9ZA53_9FUNG|nr:hypothetical protein BB560_004111 [Smittium megazygosporum]